jgi:hypothetical protein
VEVGGFPAMDRFPLVKNDIATRLPWQPLKAILELKFGIL